MSKVYYYNTFCFAFASEESFDYFLFKMASAPVALHLATRAITSTTHHINNIDEMLTEKLKQNTKETEKNVFFSFVSLYSSSTW